MSNNYIIFFISCSLILLTFVGAVCLAFNENFSENNYSKYNISLIKETLNNDSFIENIKNDDDDFDILGIDDAPLMAITDDTSIFLLNQINQPYVSNVSYFEPDIVEMISIN